jgi:hypothetical protein
MKFSVIKHREIILYFHWKHTKVQIHFGEILQSAELYNFQNYAQIFFNCEE